MVIYTKLRIRWIFTMFAIAFLTAAGFGDISKERAQAEYQKSLTITVKALKDVYEPGELVPLVVAIANHSSEPVYLFTDTPDILGTSAGVRDVNGARIEGDPVPTPPPPPLHYYMEKDGRQIYVVPLSKIEGPGVLLSLIPDALSRHHKHLSEGIYHLDPGAVPIIHNVSDLIFREDVAHRLWVDPRSPMTKRAHKVNTVKIQIRRKAEHETPIASAPLFTWPSFLIGAAAGIAIIGVVLLLRKKASSRGKSRAT